MKGKHFILLFTALMLMPSLLWASAYGKVRSGNSLFRKQQFDKSLDKYREAQISAPDNTVVHFNIGNVLHKLGDYDGSDAEYIKALNSKDLSVRSKAHYNLGNNAAAREKYDEAVEQYKKCLALDPGDMDAKYNIEYLARIKNDPKQQNKDGKKENRKAGKGKDENGNGNNEAGERNRGGKEGRNKREGQMSKEDAQRILQYYNDMEKNSAAKRKLQKPELPKTDKDW